MNINRIPEPALIRGALVTITGVIALVINKQIDTAWIDAVLTIYGLLTPLVAGLLIRPAVVPLVKLVKPAGGEGDSGADVAAGS